MKVKIIDGSELHMKRNVMIKGIGRYLPPTIVTAEEIDKKIGKKEGWVRKHIGVVERRYETEKTVSEMAVCAIAEALEKAEITEEEIDCLVYGGASVEQIIPCTATLVKEKMNLNKLTFPAFDINSTCLSFVTALDMMSHLVDKGVYKHVVIVTAEKASAAINYKEPESSALFGDGAVAIVLSKSEGKSHIPLSHFETYEEGAHYCEIKGGGSKIPPTPESVTSETAEQFLFHMDGRKVFKVSYKLMEGFLERAFQQGDTSWNDIDVVVPHQASPSAMELIRKKLDIKKENYMVIVETLGNMIAASIPMALYEGIHNGKIKRGDDILLLGTSAGLTIGAMHLVY